jgi:hypothetical protein
MKSKESQESFGFKKLFDRTIPIVMKDRYQIKDLKEILDSYDGGLNSIELDDYIEQLGLIEENFLKRITNNLLLSGIKEGAKEIAGDILDRIIILGKDTSSYNCHGWSFGCVHNIPLSSNKGDLLEELQGYTYLKDYMMSVDKDFVSFFSQGSKSILKENVQSNKTQGNIAVYYRYDKVISHSAKYVEQVNWYSYEEKYYADWYKKDKGIIKFDESGKICTINNYTSKLGMGYLVAHDYGDLVPLYGEDIVFYDFIT